MTADKPSVQTKLMSGLVDVAFYTSDIGQKAVFFYNCLQLRERFDVAADWCTQKNTVAQCKLWIGCGITDLVDGMLAKRFFCSSVCSCVCHDTTVRKRTFQCKSEASSDKAKADKTKSMKYHIVNPSFRDIFVSCNRQNNSAPVYFTIKQNDCQASLL